MDRGVTKANANRKIRQEALRDQLSNKGHVQHVIEIAEKLSDPKVEIDQGMVQRYKIAIDTKLALLKKYLPDLKALEHTGEGGGAVEVKEIRNTIVDPAKENS